VPRVNADAPVALGGRIKQPLQVSPENPAIIAKLSRQIFMGVVVFEIAIEKSGSVGM
jgi:hypothetical protein